MRNRPQPPAHQEGMALLLAIVVLLLVASVLTLLADSIAQRQRAAVEHAQRARLAALTDAGIAHSLAILSESPASRGVPRTQLGLGWYESSIERTAASGRIEIIAGVGPRTQRATADVTFSPRPTVVRWRAHVDSDP